MEPDIDIIDDEEDIRKLLKNILKNIKANIHTFKDAKEFLEYQSKNSIRNFILVVDIMMPEINGIEMVKILSGKNLLIDIPVLFLTAYPNDVEIAESFNFIKTLALDYLGKPFNVHWLIAKLENLIKIKITHTRLSTMSIELLDAYSNISNINSELNEIITEKDSTLEEALSKNDYLIARLHKMIKEKENTTVSSLELSLEKLKGLLSRILTKDITAVKALEILLENPNSSRKEKAELLKMPPEALKTIHSISANLDLLKELLHDVNILRKEHQLNYNFKDTSLYKSIKVLHENNVIPGELFEKIKSI